jgi:hypothetical protein
MAVLPRFRAIIASIFVGVTLHLSHTAAYASVSSMDRSNVHDKHTLEVALYFAN